MNYEHLEDINSKLAKNPQISDHNKEVLDEFFRESMATSDAKKGTLRDYSSRWNCMAELIDFDLDNPERDDLVNLVYDINNDKLKKQDGSNYSAHTKQKCLKTIQTFYNNFINIRGRGYNKDIDGPVLVSRLTIKDTPSVKVRKDSKPTPEQIKEICQATNSLVEKAVILFAWSTGCRVGEVWVTDEKPEPLRWENINFRDDDMMSVKLGLSLKPSNPRRRTIYTPNSKPIMKKLYNQQNAKQSDPVFLQKNATIFCPDCDERAKQVNRATYKNRRYRCKDPSCSWEGSTEEAKRKRKPMTDDDVRAILRKAIAQSDVTGVDKTPHKFCRKSRALHKQANDWKDGSIRGFFGWSEGSSAPKHYKEALKVNQKKAVAQQHPELNITVDGRFLDDSLKPSKCALCDHLNSPLWDFCGNPECDHQLTHEALVMSGHNPESVKNDIVHESKDELIAVLQDEANVSDSRLDKLMMTALDKKVDEKGTIVS